MAFTVPVFNLAVNLWRPPNAPPAVPTSVFAGQLYFPTRGMLDITPGDNALWNPPIYLRCPIGTDVRVNDVVEIAAGDGWIYKVRWVDRMHRGFPNEYVGAVLEHVTAGPPPPGGGFVLLEGGDFVLEEGGGKIVLE